MNLKKLPIICLFLVFHLSGDCQFLIDRFSQIIEFYDSKDYKSLKSLMTTMDYKLESSLPSYESDGTNYLEELNFSKNVMATKECRSCISGEKKEMETETVKIIGKIRNRNRQSDKTISFYMSEWIPYVSLDATLYDYSRRVESIIGEDVWRLSDCYIGEKSKPKDETKTFMYYGFEHCDKLLPNRKWIVKDAYVEGTAFNKLNDYNAFTHKLVRVNVIIHNNEYFEDNLGSNNEVRIYLNDHGTYEVPAEINGVLKIRFTFDTGASVILLSPDVASSLMRTGTLSEEDYLGESVYSYAGGSTESLRQYRLKSIKIGNKTINNVICAVGNNINASMLLGQSFLSRIGRYEFDYERMRLIFR